MSFGICIMKNPLDEWTENNPVDSWDENQGDHRLGFDFDYNNFSALQNFLAIKLYDTKQRESESYIDREERLKNQYLKAAKEKGYEMLGRIWYWYESVSYFPPEINQLLEECLKLKSNAQNSEQVAAMEKLIIACNEANKINSGIFLGSD